VVLLATVAGVAVAETVDAFDADRTYDWDSPELAVAAAQAESHLRPDGGQVVLTSETPDGNWYMQGALLAFEHRGFAARVPADIAETFGDHRVRTSAPVQARLRVLANTEIMGFTGRPGWHVIGFGGRRSLAATARTGERIATAQRRLQRELRAGRLTEEQFTRRAAGLPPIPRAVLILERDR
jgi:hypothetical protein